MLSKSTCIWNCHVDVVCPEEVGHMEIWGFGGELEVQEVVIWLLLECANQVFLILYAQLSKLLLSVNKL